MGGGDAVLARLASFPLLEGLEPRDRMDLLASARLVHVSKGSVVFGLSSPCDNYLFVTAGSVKVSQVAENGREIVLYRVGRGDTCILTANCLLTSQDYPAEGVAENDVEAIVLSSGCFQRLMSASAIFREFVMQAYATRLSGLLLLLQEVVMRKTDCRLADRLLSLMNGDGMVRSSHQELAAELGTAREVVSRQLKEFERRGWVRLERRNLVVLANESLRRLAGS
ncbi:MAG: Crp/Fnr family transcriptional regulator [Alphaproteobacteria bacterium]